MLTINALLGFPLIIVNILKKSKKIPILIGIFSFTIGYFFIPSNDSYDIYRHYWNFKNLTKTNFFLIHYGKDFYLRYLILFLRKVKLEHQYMSAFSCFILYFFLIKSYISIERKIKLDSKSRLFWILTLLMSVSFVYYTSLRYPVAIALYIYGVINIIYLRNNLKGLLFFIFSFFSHFGILPIIVLTIFFFVLFKSLRKLSIKNFKIIVIICFILGNLISIEFIVKILKLINSFGIINFNIESYILGEWGINYLQTQNILGKFVSKLMKSLKILIILYYSLINIKVNSLKLKRLNIILISYSLILQKFYVPFERVEKIIFILIIFSIVTKIKMERIREKNNIIIILVITSIFITQFFDIRSNIESYIISYGKLINISLINIIYNIIK